MFFHKWALHELNDKTLAFDDWFESHWHMSPYAAALSESPTRAAGFLNPQGTTPALYGVLRLEGKQTSLQQQACQEKNCSTWRP